MIYNLQGKQYLCMPLRSVIKSPWDNWEKSSCPQCGSECWLMHTQKLLMENKDYELICPKCVVKKREA